MWKELGRFSVLTKDRNGMKPSRHDFIEGYKRIACAGEPLDFEKVSEEVLKSSSSLIAIYPVWGMYYSFENNGQDDLELSSSSLFLWIQL